MMAIGDGAIKTFPLRGIKDSPPYLHDGRLLTLDDTVEFFNLILGHSAERPRRRQTWLCSFVPFERRTICRVPCRGIAADREETPMILEHATWFLFAWVFCNQAGIPVPVIPALVGAGALAGNGHLGMAVIVGIAVGAALAADLTWYGLGRWRGARALKILGRLAPTAGMLVRRAQRCLPRSHRTIPDRRAVPA